MPIPKTTWTKTTKVATTWTKGTNVATGWMPDTPDGDQIAYENSDLFLMENGDNFVFE